jgi:putative nucleotidyltransferase with HDIG domain
MEQSLKQREDKTRENSSFALQETPGAQKGTRLLIVDDEKMILKTFSLMMSEYGFFLRTASAGAEALELIRQDRFDVVFLDQHIGKERGLDLMQTMSRVDPGLYFVIITANGNANLAVDALKRGAADFLVKPFFAADIVRSIEFVLRKRDLDNQKKELLQSLETKVRERTQELESMYVDVLASLAQALEARDFGTFGHCKRVSHYAGLIADELGFDAEAKRYLEIGALLHDVGKIGINDLILLKPDKLDTDEWQNLKRHPEKGVEILKPLKYLEPALPGILHHHENYDGSGYPAGLKGEEIPLMARIITVADAWDVMRSDRPYRKAKPKDDALLELRVFSGRQFDPAIVDIFLKHMTASAPR